MTRHNMIVVALGSLAIASAPFAFAHAQSGDALAKAEATCIDRGVGPGSPAFNPCVGRTAAAFDIGNYALGYAEAQRAADARSICLSYGLSPRALGYRQCVNNELAGRDTAQAVRKTPAPAYADPYGFYTDREGNLRDRNGEVVRPLINYAHAPD